METCKPSSVEPQAYLGDVLTRLVNNQPKSRLNELAPWSYVVSVVLLAPFPR